MPTQTHTVTIAQALASNQTGLAVSDTAANIAGVLPNAALVARVASFTVAAPAILTVAPLLALASLGTALHAAAGALTLNSAATVTAAQLTALEATPGFTLGSTASLTLSDNTAQITALLAAHPAWFAQLAGVTVHLDGTSIGAYPAVLLNNFAAHKPLTFVTTPGNNVLNVAAAAHDLGSNAASLDSLETHTAVSFTLTNDGAPVIASDAAGLATLAGFSPAAHTLYVSDTAANIAAHASTLFGAGFATIQVMSGTFAGSAAQLTDPTLRILAGAHAQLATSATVSGQAAATMVALPGFSLAMGAQLSVSDTAANLAATAPAWLAFASGAALSANATIPAATANSLVAISTALGAGFSLGGHSLTISDALPTLLALSAPAASLATTLALSANALTSAAQANAFAALPHASLAGYTVAVTDTASNLLTLTGAALADTTTHALSADATVSAASFAALRALPFFSLGGHALTIADTATNLLGLPGSLALAGTTLLSANAQVSAAQLTALSALPGFSANGHAVAVADTASALLALSPAAQALVTTTTLAADATVTAAQAASLAAEPGFTTAGHHLTIADSAANLAALAPAVASLATAEMLTGSAMLSAAAAAALTASHGFSLAPGASLTITDSLPALLALPALTQSFASALVLNANAAATAAQVTAFAGLPNAALGGHTISVADSAANLLTLSGTALADTASAALSANATISGAQLTALAALPGFSASGHAITVTDTAADLLALPPQALSLITAATLSADATVTAAQALTLMAEPGFTPGAYHLNIADTAAALLALPHAAQIAANTLMLATSQSVTAAQLTQLAALGIKFDTADHALICTDIAANLIALSPTALALANAEILNAPATVSAATATSLAGLPNLSQFPGATLTIQDSVANLIGLGAGEPAITSIVQLAPGSSVSITAAQAHALAAIPHFTPGSAMITVWDTVAGLSSPANAGWQSVSGTTEIIDTAANLAANAGTALGQGAVMVTLSANAQINAAAAAQIATIPHFSAGTLSLIVSDTASDIAAQAAAINSVATSAVVTDSGPVSAAVADQLATVSAAGKLSFQGGDQLLVQDSFANLTNPANSTGYALAARIGVADTAANLVTASAHNWGALNPSYTLIAGGLISAAQAETLSSLGSHYSNGGYLLEVSDGAAAVAGAASALAALGILAKVNDTAANIGANAPALQAMAAEIAGIRATDEAPVSAATAAALSGLASKLVGPPLHVADNAADVDSYLSGLNTLGLHVRVAVTDTAADVAAVAGDLATLGTLSVALTDTAPVTAATAAGLDPIATHLIPGTALAVTDTGAAIVAQEPGLLALNGALGTLTLSDGTTQSAATAAALAPLDSHLAAGTMLTAIGNGAAITANEAGLLQLASDGHLAGVIVANTSVADATTNEAALNALPATVTIVDSAADVDAGLNALANLAGLSTIALTDGGTPALAMSIASFAADTPVLAKIITPYSITISDTAADIEADLAAGPASILTTHAGQIGAVTVSDGLPVILTQAQILSPGIDDSANAALGHFTGILQVTGVDIAHIAQVLTLSTHPTSITVLDTGADIGADLAQGNTSQLLSVANYITHITASDGELVSLTASQVLFPGVDDGPSSAFAKLSNTSLVVTDTAISQLASLANLDVTPTSISVSDTAADIAADLASPSSALRANLVSIHYITVSDGQPIALTEAQALQAGVDDGIGSVLSRISDAQFTVSGVDVGHLTQVLGLPVAPESVAVTDTAAHISSGIATIAADIGHISSITVTSGPAPNLSANEALLAHIDDGAGSVVDRIVGHVFNVFGAKVAQLAPLVSLADTPASIAVTDSSANIVADLLSGSSSIAADLSLISTIAVTHGTLTLTDAQAETILNTQSLDAVMGRLLPGTIVAVTGAPVSDLAGLATSGWSHVSVAVTDTADNIAADLNASHSSLAANNAALASVTLDAGGSYSAETVTEMAALPAFSTGGYNLDASDTAAAIVGLGTSTLGVVHAVQVVDTDVNVAAELDALQAKYAGALSIIVTNPSAAITVTAGQYIHDAPTIDAIINPGIVTITGSAADLAPLAATLGADTRVFAVDVTDNANNVVANLANLQLAGAKLGVTLTDSSLLASVVAPLLSLGSVNPAGIRVIDTGAQIAAVAESGNQQAIAYLNTQGSTLSGDSAVTAKDAAALEGLTGFSKNGHLLQVWDTAAHLTTPAYAAALASNEVDAVYLKTTGGAASVTAATAAGLFGIAGFHTGNPDGTQNVLSVSDTATHIDATLAALTSNRASLGTITVNASATVSDQTLADLQGLAAVAAPATTLTVRDTAATIANNAAAQGTGHTIEPVAWALSGNGSVTEAQAAFLGTLANFSTGAYTMSLNLASNTVISIADANALGNIASAITLTGAHPIVDGTVAQLATLTPAALGLVTPALMDSVLNIGALPANSPLLTGTVEVTGGDPLTAQQAGALLALVHTGPGQGIAAANLSFDHAHTVTDSIAGLRALTTGTGWTGNTATHTDFTLDARDSAANLTNPANTAYLSGLSQTGLATPSLMNAATATSLANIASTIHFQHDQGIFVQDSVSSLLDPSNSAGLSLADSVSVAGQATVDAADAESLFGIHNLELVAALTISDSSANLLDGVLGQDIAASPSGGAIIIQLAGPETLDADTAQALVSLPGFADTHNLTIADASSYLLNTANLTAEQMAASVTLSGDETVSANTVLRLSEIPHFTPGTSHLILANNDFANNATLHAIADDGSAFQSNGHMITLTQDALDLSPTEYAALQSDIVNANGHAIGMTPTVNALSDTANMLTVSATGIAGGTVHVYAQDGTVISSTQETNAGFTITAPDTAPGHNFAITESAGGVEGAPLVVLDATGLESIASAAGVTFSSNGQIQIDPGKFVNLYEAGSVPALSHPALVYDPVAHTVSLDLPGGGAVPLITLGGTTHPSSLDLTEIVIKHHG